MAPKMQADSDVTLNVVSNPGCAQSASLDVRSQELVPTVSVLTSGGSSLSGPSSTPNVQADSDATPNRVQNPGCAQGKRKRQKSAPKRSLTKLDIEHLKWIDDPENIKRHPKLCRDHPQHLQYVEATRDTRMNTMTDYKTYRPMQTYKLTLAKMKENPQLRLWEAYEVVIGDKTLEEVIRDRSRR